MLGKLFEPLAMKISGGIIAVLLIALALSMIRAASLSDRADRLSERAVQAETSHAVTAASLNSLESELAAMVAEGEARRSRVVKALTEARREGELLRSEADEIRAAIIADPCVTPDEIMRGSL